MISIIIPAINEEKYLPRLLDAIFEQSFNEYEIIVADAGSKDKTEEIAKKNGCKVIGGGLPGKGKNEGARTATGDLILFVDADVRLPKNFLKKSLEEFKKRDLGVASFCLQSENRFHNWFYGIFFNFPSKITEKFLPQAMNVILAKKQIHQKIGGFDEAVMLGEELDYLRRAKKNCKFGLLKSVKIIASSRRYEKDGWIRTWSKYFLCQIHMILFGPVKSDIFKYKFNHYNSKKK